MHPMRHLLALMEAPRKPVTAAPSHADRARQEQDRQAQEQARLKAEAATLKAQAQEIISKVNSYEFGKWQHDWTEEVRAVIRKIYRAHLANAKEEFEYAREADPEAKLTPVNFLECLSDGFIHWWDTKKNTLDWSDGTYRQGEYMRAHNRTEMSDDLSRLQSEVEVLSHIHYHGGFGSAGEMTRLLNFLADHLDTLARYSDGGWSDVGETVKTIVTSGIPLILLYCNSIAAVK